MSPRRAQRVRRVDWRVDDPDRLCLAFISDTHSKAHARAEGLIAAMNPDGILHAGDIGSPEVLKPFSALAPFEAVRGNIDGDIAPDVVCIDIAQPHRTLRVLMTHIALYGPKLRKEARDLCRDYKPDLFVCGHSHVPFVGQEGHTVVFNPGSIGPRRFHLPISFGRLLMDSSGTSLQHFDCETGEPWLPPGA